jgi:hypothetical protein
VIHGRLRVKGSYRSKRGEKIGVAPERLNAVDTVVTSHGLVAVMGPKVLVKAIVHRTMIAGHRRE